MASVKVKFRPSTIEGKEGTIYYQIIQNRVIRQLKTDFRIFTDEWNEAGSCIIVGSSERSNLLLSLQERIEWDLKRLDMIIRQLDNRKAGYTADDIVASFQSNTEGQSLFNFMQGIIAHLKQMDKIRTAENYSCTLKSFMQFRGDRDILLSEIDSDLMQLYEAYLHGKGAVRNTSSFYMRILRAVYNRALEKELMEQRNPFRHVYTGVDKTVKRAVPLSAIKRMKNLDLSLQPNLEFARDMFLFSFYTRGMSFIDMAHLKKKDLQNGFLSYRRRKTGQQLVIKWEKCMQEIVNKCHTWDRNPYLLPILNFPNESRKQYKYAQSRINVHLKEIANMIGVSIPLSMYVARHSWASIAKSKNIPISVISEGMGHDSELTTQIYLASLDNTIVDNANAQILKCL
ncbi:site-specific integrase [Alistipes putredinis]|uniref:site-specific integrase n=1 Tax=Alistipes putredinis TaxID=28117 RepID=UPI003FD887BD